MPAALGAPVGDVVVEERGVVEHLDGRGEADAVLRGLPVRGAGPGGEQHQRGPDPLAPVRQEGSVRAVQQRDIAPDGSDQGRLQRFPVIAQPDGYLFFQHRSSIFSNSSASEGNSTSAREGASSIPLRTKLSSSIRSPS